MTERRATDKLSYITASAGLLLENNLSPLALRSDLSDSNLDTDRVHSLGGSTTQGSDRLAFEIDRDRILHCRQFRKLARKTQLLILPERGDERSRLTHTMEVYQLATSMARRFNLNLAATEAIALAHDVGHTPFGHAGEEALNEKMREIGGFHHAAQSVRTLDFGVYDTHYIEKEKTYGLNLTFAVREGILKHGWFGEQKSPYHFFPKEMSDWNLAGEGTRPFGSLESQVARVSDQIAYLNHDIDDLMILGFTKIVSKRVIRRFFSEKHKAEESAKHVQQLFINLLSESETERVKELVRDVYNYSKGRINNAIDKNMKLVDFEEPLIYFGPEYSAARELFYDFFEKYVYRDERIKRKNENGKKCLSELYDYLFNIYESDPDSLPCHIREELMSEKPWWEWYMEKILESSGGSKPVKTFDKSKIACMIAAGDAVADLTDSEAEGLMKNIRELSSQSGKKELDRILEIFPNDERRQTKKRNENAIREEFYEIFPTRN